MRLISRNRARWMAATFIFAWLVSPMAFGGNTCRDTIDFRTCRYLGRYSLRCCQYLSGAYRWGPCSGCELYMNRAGLFFFTNGGITDAEQTCVPQTDACR